MRAIAIDRAGLWCAVMALGVGAFGGLGVKSAKAQSACMYEIVAEISTEGCTPGTLAPITVTALNDSGVAVGFLFDCAFNAQPFMWSQEMGFVAIPLPPGVTQAFAEDISNSGEIVGSLDRLGMGSRAFRYKDGVWTELPPTGSGLSSDASGVNDDGWVAGERDTDAGIVAFRWRDDVVDEFQPRSGDTARARDVNENVSAAGQTSGSLQGSQRAFWWFEQTVVEIPPLPGGETSDGKALNDNETVAGTSGHQALDQLRSWYFLDGDQVDLGMLPEADHRTTAFDLNNAGQIIGRSEGVENGTATPFLWQHGKIADVQPLIVDPPPTLSLETASAINNIGWIVVGSPVVVLAPLGQPPGDVNIDCTVDEFDLIAVLDDWGPDKLGHLTDMVTRETFQPPGDGHVDAADLAFVLGNWSVTSSSSQSLPKRMTK